jgi:hypothetical protein
MLQQIQKPCKVMGMVIDVAAWAISGVVTGSLAIARLAVTSREAGTCHICHDKTGDETSICIDCQNNSQI